MKWTRSLKHAGFSASIAEDEYGYTCAHYVAGRIGIVNNYTALPLTNSCEKMCFPTKQMDDYVEEMYSSLIQILHRIHIIKDQGIDIQEIQIPVKFGW